MYRLFGLIVFFLLACDGNKLPKVQVRTIDDRKVYLSDYRGKPVLLYVWSKTCAGHTADLRRLSKILEGRPDYWVISYAVAMTPQEVRQSYAELGIEGNFLTLVDTEVRLNDHIPITFLPSTYLFDAQGRLLKVYPGLAGW
ncbi:MAG: TlpA family protein disulfide reductase [Aquificaceae bacterium]|nr:TlpA family protein disulfide reductase [Aquificaceae bacterium]MCX8059865.1 TlpA family protein disulfide reductase [Aquificaceae bacterium]MDW8096816.1 TlpA disulfide reductase family protein [Aquificaceae bacterium]